ARGMPNLFWFHCPSGAFFGGKRQGAIMKSLGWMAGLPDLFAIHNGRVFAIELKSETGRVSDAQLECLHRLPQAGALVTTATGIHGGLGNIEMFGLLQVRWSGPILNEHSAKQWMISGATGR